MAQTLVGADANVGFMSRVGQDDLSASFVAEAANDDLDVSGIGRDADRSLELYLISLIGVQRSFENWRGASATKYLVDDRATLSSALKQVGLIRLSGLTFAILSAKARKTLIGATAQAQRVGAVVSFDPNARPHIWTSLIEIRETIGSVLAETDVAPPGFDDEAIYWGDETPYAIPDYLAQAHVREVVVKNAEGPVSSVSNGHIRDVGPPAVTGICHTTGAGGAFNVGDLFGAIAWKNSVGGH